VQMPNPRSSARRSLLAIPQGRPHAQRAWLSRALRKPRLRRRSRGVIRTEPDLQGLRPRASTASGPRRPAAFPASSRPTRQAYLDQIAVASSACRPCSGCGEDADTPGASCATSGSGALVLRRFAWPKRVLSLSRACRRDLHLPQPTPSLAPLRASNAARAHDITVMGVDRIANGYPAPMGVVTHQYAPWVDYVMSAEGEASCFHRAVNLVVRDGVVPSRPAGLIRVSLIGQRVREAKACESYIVVGIGGGARRRGTRIIASSSRAPARGTSRGHGRSPVHDYDD